MRMEDEAVKSHYGDQDQEEEENRDRDETIVMERIMTTVRKISKKKRIIILFPHHLALLETQLIPPSLSGSGPEAISHKRRELTK